MKDHDQLYGLIEMEIILKLECGLDVEFTPDWVSTENHADHSKVRWELQDNAGTEHMDDVQFEFSPAESVYEPDVTLENLRLLYGHNS